MNASLFLAMVAAASSSEPPVEHLERQAEVIGLRTDHGKAWDFGLAYLHAHESRVARGGLGASVFFQYGVDVRAVRHEGAYQAVLGFGTGRISMMGDAGGFGMEASLGADLGHGAPVVAEAGAFFGAFFFELGYAYRFPIAHDRPDWLSSHQLALRIQIPVWFHSEKRWQEK